MSHTKMINNEDQASPYSALIQKKVVAALFRGLRHIFVEF
jgi:hypothetical protein